MRQKFIVLPAHDPIHDLLCSMHTNLKWKTPSTFNFEKSVCPIINLKTLCRRSFSNSKINLSVPEYFWKYPWPPWTPFPESISISGKSFKRPPAGIAYFFVREFVKTKNMALGGLFNSFILFWINFLIIILFLSKCPFNVSLLSKVKIWAHVYIFGRGKGHQNA